MGNVNFVGTTVCGRPWPLIPRLAVGVGRALRALGVPCQGARYWSDSRRPFTAAVLTRAHGFAKISCSGFSQRVNRRANGTRPKAPLQGLAGVYRAFAFTGFAAGVVGPTLLAHSVIRPASCAGRRDPGTTGGRRFRQAAGLQRTAGTQKKHLFVFAVSRKVKTACSPQGDFINFRARLVGIQKS